VILPTLRPASRARHTRSIQPINGNNFRAFAVLNTAHRTLTHCLQHGVIQPPRIVCPHVQHESYSHRYFKKSLLTYVLINNLFRCH
jgi:hypothetical protein